MRLSPPSSVTLVGVSLALGACTSSIPAPTGATHFVAVLSQRELERMRVHPDSYGVVNDRQGKTDLAFCAAKCGHAVPRGQRILACHVAYATPAAIRALSLPESEMIVCELP